MYVPAANALGFAPESQLGINVPVPPPWFSVAIPVLSPLQLAGVSSGDTLIAGGCEIVIVSVLLQPLWVIVHVYVPAGTPVICFVVAPLLHEYVGFVLPSTVIV